MIQKGSKFYLKNTNLANVPGVNPIQFDSLEDYEQFIKWQRSQGIRCPVLYLQASYDTQGEEVYKARPSPNNIMPGLPIGQNFQQPAQPPEILLYDAARNDPPYNMNSFPGYDPQDQYIGVNTPLDKMFHAPYGTISPNPMDTTWGGLKYTQSLIDKGYFSGDEVYEAGPPGPSLQAEGVYILIFIITNYIFREISIFNRCIN